MNRPAHEARDEAFDEWWEREGPCAAASEAFGASVGFKAGWDAGVAVVRPTRDQIAAIVAWPWPPGSPPPHPFSDIVPTKKDFDAADALLAAFWPEPEGNTP